MGQPGNRQRRTTHPHQDPDATFWRPVAHTDLEGLAVLDPDNVVVRYRRGRSIFGTVWHAESCRRGRGRLRETALDELDSAYAWCHCRPEVTHLEGPEHLDALIEIAWNVTSLESSCDAISRCRPASALQRSRVHHARRALEHVTGTARPEAADAVARWAASVTGRLDGVDLGDDAELYADVVALLHAEPTAGADPLAWDAWRQSRVRGEGFKARAERVQSAVEGTKWEPLWNSPSSPSRRGSLWRGFVWSFKVDRTVRRWDRELYAAAVSGLDGDRFAVLAPSEEMADGPWRGQPWHDNDVAVLDRARQRWSVARRVAVVPAAAAADIALLLGWSVTGEGSQDEATLVARLVDTGLDGDAAWATAHASMVTLRP